MRKFCLSIFILSLSFLLVAPGYFFVNAASLSLTHIGSLATGGARYSEWWYTGTSFTLRGMAEAGSSVSVNIDGDIATATADSEGNWSHPVVLSDSDYDVTISSGSDSYSFVLHAGQYVPSDVSDGTMTYETTQSTMGVPPTGYSQILGILISSTLAAAGIYLYLQGKRQSKKAYVKSLLNSLE